MQILRAFGPETRNFFWKNVKTTLADFLLRYASAEMVSSGKESHLNMVQSDTADAMQRLLINEIDMQGFIVSGVRGG